MPLKAGDVVDRYVIESPLGTGGMGEVYRARDTRLHRHVALKILHAEAASPESGAGGTGPTGGAARMLREARAAAALDHPNVVAIFDVGQIEAPGELQGTTYLAMELIKGQPLRAKIGDGRVPMSERVRWLVEVAKALAAAHRAGIVHRDIKPENVMVRDDGHVKVLDFGIAKRAHGGPVDVTSSTEGYVIPTMTTPGMVVGTPLYMAPEQLRAEPLDGRADQFSWGVLAYELLTGRPPWEREGGGIAIVAQILSAAPKPLASYADVPESVASAVARAMQKDKDARFASMDELLEALTGKVDAFAPTLSNMRASNPDLGSGRAVATTEQSQKKAAVVEELFSAPTEAAPKPPSKRPPPAAAAPPRRWPLLAGLGAAALAAIAIGVYAKSKPSTSAAPSASTSAAAARECTKRSECTAKLGEPAMCTKAGRCARLASEDCEVRADPTALADDDTVWFGTMYPKGQPNFDPELRAVDLARQDFAQMMSGLARSRADAPVRPFGLVACDDAVDPKRAARHLVEDVGIPAVIGFHSASEAVDLESEIFIPGGVAAIVPMSTSPIVTSVPQPAGQPRLVWRTTYSSKQPARVMGQLIDQVLEPRFRNGPDALSKGAHLRVALVRQKGRGGATWDALLLEALRFNGKSVVENGDDFKRIVIDDSSAETADADVVQAAAELQRFGPQVVIPSFNYPMKLLERLEKEWGRGRRPAYVVPTNLGPEYFEWAGASVDRRRRLFGVIPLPSTSVNARFVMHYNETAPEPVTLTLAPNSSYDSFYLLAYATYALRDEDVSGMALSRAISKLVPPGKPVDVGPTGIFDAYSALRRGESIDLNGAFGSLDFDVATGEQPFKFAVECVGVGDDGRASHGTESGLVFSGETYKLEGTMHCP